MFNAAKVEKSASVHSRNWLLLLFVVVIAIETSNNKPLKCFVIYISKTREREMIYLCAFLICIVCLQSEYWHSVDRSVGMHLAKVMCAVNTPFLQIEIYIFFIAAMQFFSFLPSQKAVNRFRNISRNTHLYSKLVKDLLHFLVQSITK